MELIEAKCPNCGSVLKVNDNEKTIMCSHCNTSFLIDDVIKNNVTNNSYKIEHATIVNSDFTNALKNEVDRYIAFYNLEEFDKIEDPVNELKTKYPHKGIARIVVLHYQLLCFFSEIGGYEFFEKEVNEIEERYNNYLPKSYKNIPPVSDFYSSLGKVELKYYENIDEILTDEERGMFGELINQTKTYLENYLKIINFNEKINEKFSQYLQKYNRKKEKRNKKTRNPFYNFGFISLIAICLAVIIGLILILSNYLFFKKSYEYVVDEYNLYSPEITPIEKNSIYEKKYGSEVVFDFVSEYTIWGRVSGKKNFFPFGAKNKIIPSYLFLTWGELSSKEKSNQISWHCSFSGDISYNWNLSLGDSTFIQQNSSSNSIIPANSYIKKCIKNIKKGDLIKIKGYLVNVSINDEENTYYGTTSKSLSDNGMEIIYVTSVVWLK